VNEAIEQGITWEQGRAEALNLRGTFKSVFSLYTYCTRTKACCRFLIGDTDGAKADLEESLQLAPPLTQTWVKIASVHMERGDPSKAFEAFDEATKHNASDPDIYYHRGQGNIPIVSTVPTAYFVVVLFILNDFAQATEDYTKSTELDDTFVFSHIQLAVAQYKSGEIQKSMATFRRTLKTFPDRSEPQNY
jgi:import receptor subunit TOM70